MLMKLSIIIVNYNTKQLLSECIESIISNPPSGEFEIIVVDNNSSDGSRRMLENNKHGCVKTVLSDTNDGFSKANNKGLEIAGGEFILFLNPDTKILPGTLDECITYAEKSGAGALGCRVRLENGELDLACKRGFPTLKNSFCKFTGLSKVFPKSKLFCGYNLTYIPDDEVCEIDCLVGAFMLIPAQVLSEVGSFDEEFFMYGEDVDLCLRIKNAGYPVVYYGKSEIIHKKRASSRKSKAAKKAFYDSMLIYYKKHYGEKNGRFAMWCVKAGVGILRKIR